jgi:hypothetical protein
MGGGFWRRGGSPSTLVEEIFTDVFKDIDLGEE